MKKIILSICFVLIAVTFVSAQRAAERKAQIKQGLKEEVKLTDDQVAKVMSIEDEYRPKARAIKTDAALSDVDKKAKTKALNDEKRGKIEEAVGKESTQKIETFYSSLKKGDGAAKAEGAEKEGGEKKGKKGGKGDKSSSGE